MVTIELPPQPAQTDFNLHRWTELLEDRDLARIEGRVETDRHGHVIMSPPPSANHGGFQFRIGYILQQLLPDGQVRTECPISTADGVKAADVAWASRQCLRELANRVCFTRAPEICIEVLSPGNTKAEIDEKKALYFDAGAKEVWTCSSSGKVIFFTAGNPNPLPNSTLCPHFPKRIQLS